jgi:hypothetical protein
MVSKEMKAAMKLWVVEWSPVQRCFHVEQLGKVIKTNIETVVAGMIPGYIIVGLYETHDLAAAASNEVREKFPELFSDSVPSNEDDEEPTGKM